MNGSAGGSDAERLLALVNANWTTQAVGVAAELDLAERLAEGPRDAASLAAEASCDADALERLLRGLASLGVVERDGAGRYGLTSMGALLRREAEGSIRAWAIYTARHAWPVWGALLESVRSGRSARSLLTGREGYAHLEDFGTAATFNAAMEGMTRLIAKDVAATVDLADAASACDVGGGHGELLAALLRANPSLSGVVYDLPHAASGAQALLGAAGLANRARFVAGSFFERVPGGFDAYVLKSILHNWDDARSTAILERCRGACGPGSRLFLVERLLPETLSGTAAERATLRSDINMLVGLGGRERTRVQFEALLARCGFALRGCRAVGYGFNVLEARPST